MTRMTKDGRKLTYEMKVLQQPQRARACGSGAKCLSSADILTICSLQYTNSVIASADRRPVDPPPVVELKIYEGDAKNDITFAHNANFFLFTTLESARPIAQSRGNNLPTPFPVLTGMPVAGMAYLDRPSPAGYFIFPDLSVRHEGKYRLSFNLFEELKEAKDADSETATSHLDHPNNKLLRSSPMAPQAYVHFRLEVKSEPFVVFSAKKFPGLTESTQLSRVVAEQGCRVRIRRDVRMRRRDTKPSKDYEEYGEESGTYTRPDRYATPEMYPQHANADRARSVSNVSAEAPAPYPNIEHRPSTQESGYYNQTAYQHAQPMPAPTTSNPSYNTHLNYGGSTAARYQTPAIPAIPASQSAMTPAPSSYPVSTNYQYPTQPVRQLSNPQNYGYPASQPYHQQYPTPQKYNEKTEYKAPADYRRPSLPSTGPTYSSQPPTSYPTTDARAGPLTQNYYNQPISTPRTSTPNNVQLPPLKTIHPPVERKYDPSTPTSIMPASILASSPHPTTDVPSSSYAPQSATSQANDSSVRATKRSYERVFDITHLNQPVHSGQRPDTTKHGQDLAQIQLDDGSVEDEFDIRTMKLLIYRRADGSRQHKKCPSPIS